MEQIRVVFMFIISTAAIIGVKVMAAIVPEDKLYLWYVVAINTISHLLYGFLI